MKIDDLSSDIQEQIESIEGGNDGNKHYTGAITLPIDCIILDKVGLRTEFDEKSQQVKDLAADIKANGVLNAILVRRLGDVFMVVDGMHRFTAAKLAGLTSIPCVYGPNYDEDDAMCLQVSTNLKRVQTKPVEYARQLKKLMVLNPAMTISDMARMLGNVSSAWISQTLKLAKIAEPLRHDINEGNIPVVNAYQLARMSEEDQIEWADRARTMPTQEFLIESAAYIDSVAAEGREAAKEKSKEPTFAFKNRPKSENQAKFVEILDILKAAVQSGQISEESVDNGLDFDNIDYVCGYFHGLRYAGSLDPEYMAKKRQEAAEKEAEKLRKKQEADAKNAAERAATDGIASLLGVKKFETSYTKEDLKKLEDASEVQPANA